VVIVGAGFGGLAAAKRLEGEPVDVTVVDRHNFHQFQPLLYQVATSGLNPADVGYAVRGLFRRDRHVLFRKAKVTGVDWDAGHVVLAHEPPLPFDHLVVAAGATTNFFGVEGAAQLGFPLYTLEDAITLRNHVLSLFEAAEAVPGLIDAGVLNLVVVGGGATGVEVAGALAELVDQVLVDDFHDLDVHRARIVLVEQSDAVLGAFSPHSQAYARQVLGDRGVEVRTGVAVERVTEAAVHLSTGEELPTRCLVWAAGVQANGLAAALGVAQGRGGRIEVEPDLSIPGHPEAFAVGDVAASPGRGGTPTPQLAQPAIQGGRHAAEQILADLAGRPRTAFRYHDKGTMATIGRRAAVAELPLGIKLTGRLAWVAWLGLHLVYLMGNRNRLSVLLNWAWNYVTWDRGPRLILRPEALPQTPHPHADAPAALAAALTRPPTSAEPPTTDPPVTTQP
jgi:NADH dehydrogenase